MSNRKKKGDRRKLRKQKREQKRGFPGQDNRMVDGRQSRNKGGN